MKLLETEGLVAGYSAADEVLKGVDFELPGHARTLALEGARQHLRQN